MELHSALIEEIVYREETPTEKETLETQEDFVQPDEFDPRETHYQPTQSVEDNNFNVQEALARQTDTVGRHLADMYEGMK